MYKAKAKNRNDFKKKNRSRKTSEGVSTRGRASQERSSEDRNKRKKDSRGPSSQNGSKPKRNFDGRDFQEHFARKKKKTFKKKDNTERRSEERSFSKENRFENEDSPNSFFQKKEKKKFSSTGNRFSKSENQEKNRKKRSFERRESHNSTLRVENSRRKSNQKKSSKAENVDWSKYVNEGGESAKREQYVPKHQFTDFFLNQELSDNLNKKGYLAPTEIQDQAIPTILDGENLIGVAGTGTGKTAAFLIPIIQVLMEEKQDRYALIIAPTRELANQINDEFRSLTKGLNLFSTCLIGGSSVSESIRNLRRLNHIVIGTPGRLMDMNRQGHLNFDAFNVFVLDEFDRMLDMGFKDEMRDINNMMSDKEQTLLFSATVDPSQRKLIKEIIGGEAKEIKAATDTQKTDAIRQEVLHVNGQDKFQLMHDLISEEPEDKVILFCETKRNAEKILGKLKDRSVRADAIHGDKSQKAREIALRKFKRGQVNVLVATDVVARGIDVNDVSLVINYEPPRNYTDYVHRIGRTGRAGKSGRAVTMIN